MNIVTKKGQITLSLMLFFTLSFFITNTALAFDSEKVTSGGVKLGTRMSGSADIEGLGDDLDVDSGTMFGGFVDQKIGTNLYIGAFLDISKFSIEGEDVTQTDIGLSLKWLMSRGNSDFVFRPGIGLAKGKGKADRGDPDLFVSNVFVEAIYDKEGAYPWLAEIGLTSSDGGTDDADVTIGPIFYIRGGLIF